MFLDNSHQRGKQNCLESKGEQSMGYTTEHTLSRKLKASDHCYRRESKTKGLFNTLRNLFHSIYIYIYTYIICIFKI